MRGNELLNTHVQPDTNPGCSHIFVYRGARCSQSPAVFAALDALRDATWHHPATTIIEIGTLYGAFTRVLLDHDVSNSASSIHTFDIRDTCVQQFGGTKVTRHFGNVFLDQLPTLVSLIQRPGRCFVFCDGGDKEREVNVLCQHLKLGDIILCHDYVKHPSLVGTQAVNGWPAYESQHANISDALTTAGCEPFLEEAMQSAVWGCFVRVR